MNHVAVASVLGMLVPVAAAAQDKAPKDIEVASHWIYDDVPTAMAQAKESGKPILALFR